MEPLHDRAVASILGLAIGDALGAPFEGQRRDAIPSPVPAFERRWIGRPPGTWTGRTAMARDLWLSLAQHGGTLDGGDVVARHLALLATEPTELGTLTRRVLTAWSRGDADAARGDWERRGPEVSADNGAVSYCAPLGVASAIRPEQLVRTAPTLCAITHWDQRCRTTCLAVTVAVAAMVRGEPAELAVSEAVSSVEDRAGGEELAFLVSEAGRARPIDGPDMRFALFTAGLALQVTEEGRGFEEGLRYVVSMGGDAGANAAVAGALLGAAHGTRALPPEWVEVLVDAGTIRSEAEALAATI